MTVCGSILLIVLVWGLHWWWQQPRLPQTYSAAPIVGKVIDAETQMPLADAIVIGVWELEAPYGLEGSMTAGHLHVEEVLTDSEGDYFINGWGPKQRPGKAYLGKRSPMFVVFKEGYIPFHEGNSQWKEDQRYSELQHSDRSGETIKLEKFEGALEGYYKSLKRLNSALESVLDRIMGAGDCDWQKVPNMVLMFDRYHQKLVSKFKKRRTYHIPKISRLVARGGCSTEQDFIRKYKDEDT